MIHDSLETHCVSLSSHCSGPPMDVMVGRLEVQHLWQTQIFEQTEYSSVLLKSTTFAIITVAVKLYCFTQISSIYGFCHSSVEGFCVYPRSLPHTPAHSRAYPRSLPHTPAHSSAYTRSLPHTYAQARTLPHELMHEYRRENDKIRIYNNSTYNI